MDVVNAALYTKLEADRVSAAAGSLGTLGVTVIANKLAPQGQAFPFVVFQKQAGDDRYTYSQRAYRDLVYLVKACLLYTSDAADE